VYSRKTRASPEGDRAGDEPGRRRWRQRTEQVAIGSLTNETEYGDASACLCLSHPVDPTRPAGLVSNGVPRDVAAKQPAIPGAQRDAT
jgi:hypothetical protein